MRKKRCLMGQMKAVHSTHFSKEKNCIPSDRLLILTRPHHGKNSSVPNGYHWGEPKSRNSGDKASGHIPIDSLHIFDTSAVPYGHQEPVKQRQLCENPGSSNAQQSKGTGWASSYLGGFQGASTHTALYRLCSTSRSQCKKHTDCF